jgi:hypothetical protein
MKAKVDPRVLTMAVVYAASHDAASRSMRKDGRKKWSRKDWNVSAAEFARLAPHAIDCDPAMRAAILAGAA